jgi:hypothetical protein
MSSLGRKFNIILQQVGSILINSFSAWLQAECLSNLFLFSASVEHPVFEA